MFDSRAPRALVIFCVTLVVSAVGFRLAVAQLNIYLRKEPVDLRASFDNIPRRIGAWEATGEDKKLEATGVEALGTSLYLDRIYRLDSSRSGPAGEPPILFHLAYYTGQIDAVPHVPDRCLVAGGFNAMGTPVNIPLSLDKSTWEDDPDSDYPIVSRRDPVTGRNVPVRMPLGEVALRTTEFSDNSNPGAKIFAGYFFVANGGIAVTPGDVKRLAFRASEKRAYYCKVQVLSAGKGIDQDSFVERATEFLDLMLPEIMICLPDWAVSGNDTATTTDVTVAAVDHPRRSSSSPSPVSPAPAASLYAKTD